MACWLVRPTIISGKNRISEFRKNDVIILDCPHIENLSNLSREELKSVLVKQKLTGFKLGITYSNINNFINVMHENDTVLVANGDDIFFAVVMSDYKVICSESDGCSIQRSVKWLSNVSRKSLSISLRSALKVHKIIADLSIHSEEIIALANGTPISEIAMKEVSYPLRPDLTITFKIPLDMTAVEAIRLSTYFQTLYFK